MDMTIGEMIEAYANFDKTREFYNLYKEAVTVDLKVRYALTESYMQESSIDAILEAGDLWGSIKGWAIKAWEAIKKFFKNIWFHITRFFHSIFNRSDKWYKLEADYKKTIQDAYALAARKTQGTSGRKDATDIFEEAVLKVAKGYGIYDGKATRISDKMPEDMIKNLRFLSKVAKGEQPNLAVDDYTAAVFGDDIANEVRRPAADAAPTDAIGKLNEANDLINEAYGKKGVGFKVDEKKVDAICQILGEKKINDKVESLADILNVTYLICKPPLNFQISEVIDIIIRQSERVANKMKNITLTDSSLLKLNAELSQISVDFKKALARSKNYYIDIIVDDKFLKKIDDTGKELNEAFNKVDNYRKNSVDQSKFNDLGIEIGERDKRRSRGSMFGDWGKDGESTETIEFKDAHNAAAARALPEVLRQMSKDFSSLTEGITKLAMAIDRVSSFRRDFATSIKRGVNGAH